MAAALELVEVSKVYEVGGVELVALDHVDLVVAEHEVVTLLGPSGSGKTTLLSIAGGLLSASSGRVVVGGRDITRASARRLTAFRRRQVGFIFQSVNLVPFLTARENLLVVAELARRDQGRARLRADRLLEELGLAHRRDNLPGQLSGGERQRVAIGRALMNAPGLVLVDEPTSALDSNLGEQVMQLIVSEVKARGAAAVVVTHDSRMTRYGDRILTMADGRIAGIQPRPEWMHPRPEWSQPQPRPDWPEPQPQPGWTESHVQSGWAEAQAPSGWAESQPLSQPPSAWPGRRRESTWTEPEQESPSAWPGRRRRPDWTEPPADQPAQAGVFNGFAPPRPVAGSDLEANDAAGRGRADGWGPPPWSRTETGERWPDRPQRAAPPFRRRPSSQWRQGKRR